MFHIKTIKYFIKTNIKTHKTTLIYKRRKYETNVLYFANLIFKNKF